MKLDENVGLARYTTIGTGGPARFFARPTSIEELQEVTRFAASERLPVEVVGLGSNLLVHDEGVDAVVLHLEGGLAEVHVEGNVLVAGGGATNAVCLHRARDADLGGFEFASAIPGTVGGGVRMNAGAFGTEFRDLLLDVVLVDALGVRTARLGELGLSYRHSELEPGDVVAQARLQLEQRSAIEVRAVVSGLLEQRKATQPTNKRTFGSVFKNPSPELGAGRAIEESGLKGHQIGGARISPVHANFIENAGDATSADALALMAEARNRVYAGFGIELEREVRFLGPLALPPL